MQTIFFLKLSKKFTSSLIFDYDVIEFRMEIALRQVDPTLSLPYWDSTLDSRLPVPKDSVMWTDGLMGTSDANGSVIGGAFADFVTFQVSRQ